MECSHFRGSLSPSGFRCRSRGTIGEKSTGLLHRHPRKASPVIAQKQRNAFAEGTTAFYHDFTALFEPLRRVCREHREKYEPQLKVIVTAEASLAELERILAPVEKALSSRK
ncbi:MAG: hypothetical protein NWR21_09845 [Verrucomicrobiales bacterium]|nr:hypothetical protein [Verrucomicrobiales bacterium]